MFLHLKFPFTTYKIEIIITINIATRFGNSIKLIKIKFNILKGY